MNLIRSSRTYPKKGSIIPFGDGQAVADDEAQVWEECFERSRTFCTVAVEVHLGLKPEEERQLFHDLNRLGKKVAANVKLALVVPGSGLVKAQAEREGLDRVFKAAGFEWREPGCSMCLAMNADRLEPGERCASTSNRNFEGRQGNGGRTHLVSPAMAAAAAIEGHFVDVRKIS